ncbi:hypothetical protein [Pelagibacterium montanilacus]|uniref:hypothetical protein n=1 Tax=Pelagibacterium montanilacus TaxID=2185280 RepID=UPI000F8F5885|nr:hypothetical protein [Pelagibacterium montanilacus]
MPLRAGLAVLLTLLAAPVHAQSDGTQGAMEEGFVPPPRPAEMGGVPYGGEGAGPSSNINSAQELEEPFSDRFAGITDPQPVTLSARISAEGDLIPEGLVWRVFEPRVDESGELAMVAKSEDATATFSLPPGEYLLHVAFGRAQTSDSLYVEPGPNNRTIIFEVGALQLAAMIDGDLPIPADQLTFDIQSTGPEGQTLVAQDVVPGELVHLNAGIYTIISRYGEVNAEIHSDLHVEPGQITEATLYHRAAQVNLRLVSEEGGEAIADVEWSVQTPTGETIYTEIGAFPEAVLAEGEYVALARLGENVYNREFEVRPGARNEVEILTTVY